MSNDQDLDFDDDNDDINMNSKSKSKNIHKSISKSGSQKRGRTRSASIKRGRGHRSLSKSSHVSKSGNYDTLKTDDDNELLYDIQDKHVQKSVEGYVLFITGVHEEAKEDDIYDAFSEFGHVKQLHLNLDRKTGYVKGYAMVEYSTFKEAKTAKENLDGTKLLDQVIYIDWAFKRGPM